MYKTNEEEGGYRTIPVKRASAGPALKFNYGVEDETLRKLFAAKDFRWALSLAMNRKEISDKIYFGQVEPWGPFAYRMSSIFPGEEYVDLYKNYDPQKANDLLDGLGLKDTDGDGIREADGKPIQIVVDTDTGGAGGPHGVFEIVASQWKKIGVDLKVNTIDRSLLVARWGENAQQAYKWVTAAAIDPLLNARHWAPTIYPHGYGNVGEPIAQWLKTGGKEGVEPPEFIKEYAALFEKALSTLDPEEQIKIGKEAMKMAAENVYFLPTTDYIGIVIADARLENVPDTWLFGNQHKGIWSVRPDQVFFK
jgi:peptide/nickel transport system substrate-binding protein